MSKTYLGDSVYVETEDSMVKLTTNNGHHDDPRNVILLDPAVLRAFIDWCNANLASRSYTDTTGTLRTWSGERSIFDDVDK